MSATISIISLSTEILNTKDIIIFFLLGIIGGVLPDIDSDSSIPLKFLSFSFGFMIAFLIVVSKINIYSILEILIAWSILYLIFHYILLFGFKKFTKHRGMIHSLPAGAMFGVITVDILYYIFDMSSFHSWLGGIFIFIGFLTHLILDEIYSVDIKGAKLKKSFGTAMKLYQQKDAKSTLIVYLLTTILLLNTPKVDDFYYVLSSEKFISLLKNSIFPNGIWFADIYENLKNRI